MPDTPIAFPGAFKVIPPDDPAPTLMERQVAFWGRMAERYGFSTVLSCVLLYGIWSVVVWTADHIAEPVVKSHMRFLENTSDTLKQTGESIKSLHDGQDRTNGHLEKMLEEQAKLTKTFQRSVNDSQETKDK